MAGTEIDNNAAERAMRPIALGRKNWLFAGSDRGGKRAALVYSLIETAKINGVNPEAWLADVIRKVPDYPVKKSKSCCPGTGKSKTQPCDTPNAYPVFAMMST